MNRVSYVVTLYNKAPFLPFVIGGLAAQQGDFARQFVFVDDGSADDTLAVLRDLIGGWDDVVIISQNNAGPAAALNAGLARVEGDIVKPLDGDDRLHPWATAALLAAMRDQGTRYAYAPMGLQDRYDHADDPLQDALSAPPVSSVKESDFLRQVLRRAQTNPSVLAAETALLREIEGADPRVFIQDYSLELRLAASGPAARFDAAVMASPGLADGRLSDNEAQTLHDVNLALLRFLQDHPELPLPLQKLALKRAIGRALKWGRRRGNAGWQPQLHAKLLRAQLGWLQPNATLEQMLCAPFTVNHPIRRI